MKTDPFSHSTHSLHSGLQIESYVIFVLQIIVIVSALLLIGARQGRAQGAQVYYTDQENAAVFRALLDGSDQDALFEGRRYAPQGIAVDEDAGKLYWTDNVRTSTPFIPNGAIFRSDLDGTNREALLEGRERLTDIELDGMGHLYWIEGGTIYKADLDGSGAAPVVNARATNGLELDVANGKIYWENRFKISRSNLDGTEVEDVIPDTNHPNMALALDTTAGMIYWADPYVATIERASVDGSGREEVVALPEGELFGLQLDPDAGKMYWANNKLERFQRANLDGSGIEEVAPGSDAVRYFTLDGDRGGVLWFEWDRIRSARFDDTTIENVVLSNRLTIIRLDPDEEKVYWIDEGHNVIRRAGLDGANLEDVVYEEGIGTFVLEPVERKIYWASFERGTVHRANTDGTFVEDLIDLGPERINGFAIDPAGGKLYWTDAQFSAVRRSNLDGSNHETFFGGDPTSDDSFGGTLEIDPVQGRLYWFEEFSGEIHLLSANFDGTDRLDITQRGYKTGFSDLDIAPEGDFVYVLNWLVNPPVFHDWFTVFDIEGNEPAPFLTLEARSPDRITSAAFDWRNIQPPAVAESGTFTLMDADANEPVAGFDPIPDGAILDLNVLPAGLNVRANVGEGVESVRFGFNGNTGYRTENAAPYALFGDVSGDYAPNTAAFGEGEVTLTATPYSEDFAGGEVGEEAAVSFFVYHGTNVVGLTLIDSDTGDELMQLDEGATVDLDALPMNLNVRADVLSNVNHVHFERAGHTHTEYWAPFALFGDIDGVYHSGTFAPGIHTLRATPYAGDLFGEQPGPAYEVQLTVTGSMTGKTSARVAETAAAIAPAEFALKGNYPDPFNPVTTIAYVLPESAPVVLTVYDAYGRRVQTLVNRTQPAGRYDVRFDAGDLASGTYLYRLEAGGFSASGLMLLVK